jgi:adenine phosphoribosyltransferase
MNLYSLIKDIPNFPKQGILFKDISPLLAQPDALKYAAKELTSTTDLSKIDYFAGIESRGFILAALTAAFFGKGFLPIRKAGKLPPPFEKQSYALEYGEATIEMNHGTGKIMILDDVLATGGTLQAAIDVSERAGYQVHQVATLINLKNLNQMKFRGQKVHSVIEY